MSGLLDSVEGPVQRSIAAPSRASPHADAVVEGVDDRLASLGDEGHGQAQTCDPMHEVAPPPPRALLAQRRNDDLVEVLLADRACDGLERVRPAEHALHLAVRLALEQRNRILEGPVGHLAAWSVGDEQGEGTRRGPRATT